MGIMLHNKYCYTVQPVLRGHIWPLRQVMKFSMRVQEKGDCLIEVTAWASSTVFIIVI